jgi:dihydrofolate reductase
MRKVVMLNRISVDGFFAGPQGEMDWFIHDADVDKAAHELMDPDTLLLGRVTYQIFESFWPPIASDPNAPAEMKTLAQELNEMHKVVFSQTLPEASWINSTLVKSDVEGEIKRLKQGSGADITIFGSGTIVQQLANAGLIDEYLVVVTPVVLGKGKALFHGAKQFAVEMLEIRRFSSGNVLLHYRLAK